MAEFRKTPINRRTLSNPPGPGPFLAQVTNHLDSSFMGGLEVVLINDVPSSTKLQANTYPVKYLSPFYGITSPEFQGNNAANFNDSQKSYGMWMVPPDVGTIVMVIFVNGHRNQGYWIGCVPDTFQNFMVPGIASTSTALVTPAQKEKYGNVASLPVAEFNTNVASKDNPITSKIDAIRKPVHPFADRLWAQGLLADNIRGVTSSSARREIPSQVFGISTPGPIDTSNGAQKGNIGYGAGTSAFVSRLGGSTFVMDDGDVDGNNELVRIRTRTGHQILLHNSENLIYIANAEGTAWIEMTALGKIDVYAADSISLHTQGDFNFRADRDFNLEAGRNFNINVASSTPGSAGGNLNINAQNHLNLYSSGANLDIQGNLSLNVNADVNILATGAISQSSGKQFSINSNGVLALAATNDVSIGSASITMGAPKINQLPSKSSATAPTSPTITTPTVISQWQVPVTDVSAGWANRYQSSTPLSTIMQRVPMHEPWSQHESAANQFNLNSTDSILGSSNSSFYAPAAVGTDQGTLQANASPWGSDAAFLDKVKGVCAELGFKPIDLLSVMYYESAGSMDPAKPNGLGYYGLIQFGNDAAKSLGTTTAYLRTLTRVQQLDYVKQYFNYWGWPYAKFGTATLGQIYATVFLPAIAQKIGFAPEQVLCSRTAYPQYYQPNSRSFDPTNTGQITINMLSIAAGSRTPSVLKILSNNGYDANLNKT